MRPLHVLSVLGASLFLGCSEPAPPRASSGPVYDPNVPEERASATSASEGTVLAEAPPPNLRVAIVAGGCFWCLEGPFERMPGVGDVLAGYTGGGEEHPTYRQIGRGNTGHVEAVRIVYDPTVVTYAQIVSAFLRNIDPTQNDGQFCDRGTQYRSFIFVANAEERAIAEAALRTASETLGQTVATEIRDAGPFWIAEDYHQDYYRTHAAQYTQYRNACGRDQRLEELWGTEAAH